LELMVARLEIGSLGLELLLVRLGRAQGLAARQQEVAGVAVLDFDGLAHAAELADALQKNNVHDGLLFLQVWSGGRKDGCPNAQPCEGVDDAEKRKDRKSVFRPHEAAGIEGDEHQRPELQ